MTDRFDRLTLLQTFIRIAERGSLSAAARDLGTSQPSVSRQMAALETRLGVVLARRTTHEVALTPDGVALLADARRLLMDWEAIEERHMARDELMGIVRVVAPVGLGQNLFMAAAAQFMKDHPAVSIDWKLKDNVIRFAEEGCDCWLKIGEIPDSSLVVRPLAQVERLVVATPDFMAAHQGVALESLAWLTLGPFEGNRIRLFDQDSNALAFAVNPRMASDNIFALREAVLHGLGAAIMPRWFVAHYLDTGQLVDVAPDLRAAALPINLAIAAGAKRPARVEQFCQTIQAWCSQEMPSPSLI